MSEKKDEKHEKKCCAGRISRLLFPRQPLKTMRHTKTKTLFACFTNTDLTEGRGEEYIFALAENKSTAKRLAKRKYVQGTDARVEEVQAYFVPKSKEFATIGAWYVPAGFIHKPTPEDLQEEKILMENQAKNLLLEKFKKGEAISDQERETIVAWLQK